MNEFNDKNVNKRQQYIYATDNKLNNSQVTLLNKR